MYLRIFSNLILQVVNGVVPGRIVVIIRRDAVVLGALVESDGFLL
jgi:hypothetical protein